MKKILIIIILLTSSLAIANSHVNKINTYISIPIFAISHVPPKEASLRVGYAYELKNENEVEVTYASQGFHQQDLQKDSLFNKRLNEVEGNEFAIGYNFFYKNGSEDNSKLYLSTLIGFGKGKLTTQDGYPAQKQTYNINTTTFRVGGLFRKVVTSGFFRNILLSVGAYVHYLKYDDSNIQESGKNKNLNLITPSILLGAGYQF